MVVVQQKDGLVLMCQRQFVWRSTPLTKSAQALAMLGRAYYPLPTRGRGKPSRTACHMFNAAIGCEGATNSYLAPSHEDLVVKE